MQRAIRRSAFIAPLVLSVAMSFSGFASAGPGGKGAPPNLPDGLSSMSTGVGVPQGAPASVQQHVSQVLAGQLGQATDAPALAPNAPDAAPNAGPRTIRKSSGGGCWTRWARRNYDSIFGYNYFRYYEQISWCGNGSVLTSFYRDRWPEVNWIAWTFQGNIGSDCSLEHCNGRGSGSYSTNAYTQGQFAVCAAWCAEYKYPWVNISVTAAGDFDAGTGGT